MGKNTGSFSGGTSRHVRNNRADGARYEDAAVRYLKEKGYQIVERNYQNRCGEIDIIALDGEALVFLEIKFRKSARCGSPLEAVDSRKQERICRTAMGYFAQYGYYGDGACRFDVLGIDGTGLVTHVRNAFEFTGQSSVY